MDVVIAVVDWPSNGNSLCAVTQLIGAAWHVPPTQKCATFAPKLIKLQNGDTQSAYHSIALTLTFIKRALYKINLKKNKNSKAYVRALEATFV